MSNDEEFYKEYAEIAEKLRSSLKVILDNLNSEVLPSDYEKSNAIMSIEAYIDALIKYDKRNILRFSRVQLSKKTAYSEKTVIKELSGLKKSIALLLKLCREKMISSENTDFSEEEGKILIEEGYCDKLLIEGIDKNFFVLSEKAEKVLKNKGILGKLKATPDCSVIPLKMIYEVNKWSSLYLKRVLLINKYYEKFGNEEEYILSSLGAKEDMVFGCDISDDVEIKYVFAGVFEKKTDILDLRNILEVGEIENLIIVINSNEDKEMLEKEGFNKDLVSQLSFVIA